MATTEADGIVTITVDRAMRDVLRICIRSEAYRLEDFESVIFGADAQLAHDALARARHLVEMFDQLGWADDDPREAYEITVALESFVPWLREHGDDLADSLADEITLATYRSELETIEALLAEVTSIAACSSTRSRLTSTRPGRRIAPSAASEPSASSPHRAWSKYAST